jgi:hypothetical protein
MWHDNMLNIVNTSKGSFKNYSGSIVYISDLFELNYSKLKSTISLNASYTRSKLNIFFITAKVIKLLVMCNIFPLLYVLCSFYLDCISFIKILGPYFI